MVRGIFFGAGFALTIAAIAARFLFGVSKTLTGPMAGMGLALLIIGALIVALRGE